MKNKMFIILIGICSLLVFSCSDNSSNNINIAPTDTSIKVTFIELGSLTCVPCQQMQPVMDSIEKKYGKQISVVFIDAIHNSQEAEPYHIDVMPTQVFLDSNKTEFFRHEGFFAEDSIHILLQSKGLKIIN